MANILIIAGNAKEIAPSTAQFPTSGDTCRLCDNREEAVETVRNGNIHMAIVRTAPGVAEDIQLIRQIQNTKEDVAIVAIVDEYDHQSVMLAAKAGAVDFLNLPLTRDDSVIRLKMALDKRMKSIEESRYRSTLEQMILAKTEEIWVSKDKVRKRFIATINALLKALQTRHVYTEGHSRRVADKSKLLAEAAGLSKEEVRNIELGALFHDIGKLAIRDDVLNKNGKLTDEEYEHIKTHPLAAEAILSPLEDFVPVISVIKHEHERWDGKGYPSGLAGENIPIGARIVMIADAWDSLVFDRIYRRGCTKQEAIDEIRRCAGTQFDPKLVEIFAGLVIQKKETTRVEQDNPHGAHHVNVGIA